MPARLRCGLAGLLFALAAAGPSAGQPMIISPSPGSQLASATTNFTWTGVTGATNYWFDLGTAVGEGNICAAATAATSYTCTGIPVGLHPIYAQVWAFVNGAWQAPGRFEFRMPAGGAERAFLLSPTPGSVLATATVAFTWSAGVGCDYFWLDVGTAPGEGNISSGIVTGTSKTVSGIPLDGGNIYIRLWSHQIGGNWIAPLDYPFLTGDPRSVITFPPPGALPDSEVTFAWSAVSDADGYWLDVGPIQGSGAYSNGFLAARDKSLIGLPCDGSLVWVRLWTRSGGVYRQPRDYQYTAATQCSSRDPRATMATPVPGSTLSSTTQTFVWNAGGTGTTQYWLDAGSALGMGNYFAGPTTLLAQTVSNLPQNGSAIYVRLWTYTNGNWRTPLDYVYGAAGDGRAILWSPIPGSFITGNAATFTWTSGGAGVDGYWLDVGTSLGEGNLSSGFLPVTWRAVSNLPGTGLVTVYVRLWTRKGGVWQAPIDYRYTN